MRGLRFEVFGGTEETALESAFEISPSSNDGRVDVGYGPNGLEGELRSEKQVHGERRDGCSYYVEERFSEVGCATCPCMGWMGGSRGEGSE